MHLTGSTETVFLCILCAIKNTLSGTVLENLYLDDASDCDRQKGNNDMSQGDMYVVSSDMYGGGSEWVRRPAECTRYFDFGDRMIGVHVTEFWCTDRVKDLFLAIYSTCSRRRDPSTLLGWYNCTSESRRILDAKSTCLLLYHYRGRTTVGYYFSLKIEAKDEVLAFPAGGSAAIFFISVVLVLVVLKILCVITGYETRVPTARIETVIEEQKQILIQEESGDERGGGNSFDTRSRHSQHECEHQHPPSPLVSTLKRGTQSPAAGPSGIQHTHNIVTISHSTGASSASESASVDFDQTDFHSPPKKKHYVSSRMSRTFRL